MQASPALRGLWFCSSSNYHMNQVLCTGIAGPGMLSECLSEGEQVWVVTMYLA